MVKMSETKCSNCGLVLSSKQRLQSHIASGVCHKPEMKCACGKDFTRRYRFNEHVSKCPQANPPAEASSVAIQQDGNGTTAVGRDNNGTITNVNNTVTVNGFTATDLNLVAAEIMKNPGMLQLAREMECIHEHLTALTHFIGPPENRNIVSGDMKTSTIKTLDSHGNVAKCDRHDIVDRIHTNNRKLAVRPEVSKYTEEDLEERYFDPAVMKRDKRRIALTVENQGRYPKLEAVLAAVPEEPEPVNRAQVMAGMMDLLKKYPEYFPPPGFSDLVLSLLTVVMQPQGNKGHRLWMKLPDGWAILTSADFKNEVKEQTTAIMEELQPMCYAASDRGMLSKRMYYMVEDEVYKFGGSIFTKFFADHISG
jgi:hypothetical protein